MSHKLKSHLVAVAALSGLLVLIALLRSITLEANILQSGQGSTLSLYDSSLMHGSAFTAPLSRQDVLLRRYELRAERRHHFERRMAELCLRYYL